MVTHIITKHTCAKCMELGDSISLWWCGYCEDWFCNNCRLNHPHLGYDDTTDMNLLECFKRVRLHREKLNGKTDNLSRVEDEDDE